MGLRIKQIRLSKGMTQKDFSDSLGIVQGFLSALETGRKIPSETFVIALCKTYQVCRRWLLLGEGEMFVAPVFSVAAADSGSAGIPLLRRITERFPEIAPEDMDGRIQVPEAPADGYALRFEGDFMAPTILDGDLVIFQATAEVDNKDIVLITNRWGEVILRRYRLRGDEVYLAAENSSYVPFRPDPQTRTIGKVVAIWRKVKI